MPSKPLIKALAEAGIGSRRWLTEAIKQGRVEIDGMVVESFRHPVDVETDRLSIDGQTVELGPEKTVYLMLNKPRGVLSTARDERGRKTALDILPGKYRSLNLHPVGRLDKDSTGLLLMTNDGELTYRLTHPKFEHKKEYLVSIDSGLNKEEIRRLQEGIALEDGVTRPAVVREVNDPPFNYSITIHEGRKRQVRRMFANLGHRVLALKRVRVGNLTLGDLEEGKVRELGRREVRRLLSEDTDSNTMRTAGGL